MSEPTNADLMKRLVLLEDKMDTINQRMDQASGAWMFLKILASIALGVAVLWNAFAAYFKA